MGGDGFIPTPIQTDTYAGYRQKFYRTTQSAAPNPVRILTPKAIRFIENGDDDKEGRRKVEGGRGRGWK